MQSWEIEVYADDKPEGQWFIGLDDRLSNDQMSTFGGEMPPIVDALLAYDKPDIVMLVDGVPVLVVEKSSEVPTGHNMGQRFARMARAAELGVPCVLFFPFVAKKHGEHASPCWANPWYFKAMNSVSEFHGGQFLAINWPCDSHYELKTDGSENEVISKFVSQFIESRFIVSDVTVRDQIWAEMEEAFEKGIENNQHWPSPPPSVTIHDTVEVLRECDLSQPAPQSFQNNEESVIYECGTSNVRCDPYVGMQFVYDYSLARDGRFTGSKSKNFIVNLPKFSSDEWLSEVPRGTGNKTDLWYSTADALKFSDSIVFLNND